MSILVVSRRPSNAALVKSPSLTPEDPSWTRRLEARPSASQISNVSFPGVAIATSTQHGDSGWIKSRAQRNEPRPLAQSSEDPSGPLLKSPHSLATTRMWLDAALASAIHNIAFSTRTTPIAGAASGLSTRAERRMVRLHLHNVTSCMLWESPPSRGYCT